MYCATDVIDTFSEPPCEWKGAQLVWYNTVQDDPENSINHLTINFVIATRKWKLNWFYVNRIVSHLVNGQSGTKSWQKLPTLVKLTKNKDVANVSYYELNSFWTSITYSFFNKKYFLWCFLLFLIVMLAIHFHQKGNLISFLIGQSLLITNERLWKFTMGNRLLALTVFPKYS